MIEKLDLVPPENIGEFEKKLASELPSVVDVRSLPDCADMPLPALGILCLKAMGWTNRMIADWQKVDVSLPDYYIRRYDPQRKFAMTPDQTRALVTAFARSKKLEAISHISPAKLEAASARDLASVAVAMQRVEEVLSADGKSGDDMSRGALLIQEISET